MMSFCRHLGKWLLENTFAIMNFKHLSALETQLKTQIAGVSHPSEYSVQHEMALKASSLIRHLPDHRAGQYYIKSEAFCDTDEEGNGRVRLDILVSTGKVLRLGQEILIEASQAQINDHFDRAKKC